MTKDFDLQSPKWLEIIFAGKNKSYGAYELRNDSSNRHIKALIVVVILCITAIFLPKVIQNMILGEKKPGEEGPIITTQFKPDEKPVEQPIEIPATPPPELMVKTIMNTEAKIVETSELQEKNMAQAQEALKDLDAVLSNKTNEAGKTDGSGIVPFNNPNDGITGKKDETIYINVDFPASFPGGEVALYKWIEQNLRYPTVAAEAGLHGKVMVNFVVERDGSITNVRISQSVHESLDNEAIRLVKLMPPWLPGKKTGNAVRSYFTLPINFILK